MSTLLEPSVQLWATTSATKRGGLWLGLIASLLWLLCMGGFIHQSSQVTPDSALYLECAKNLALNHGCLVTPWSGLTANRWETMGIVPPGYPMLVAPLIALGVAPLGAAIAVSVISGCLFFVVLSLLVWRLLPPALSVIVLALVIATPALWEFSASAISDVPFLLLTAASLLATLNATQGSGRKVWWLFTAGLLGGGAYLIRTAALALVGTEGLFLLVANRDLRGKAVTQLAPWAGGLSITILPFLSRNWIVFHSLVPYSMPPSSKSFLENLRDMLSVVVTDLVGTKHVGNLVSSSNAVLMIVAVAGLVGMLFSLRYGSDPIRLLTLYAGAYFALILVWRTKYHAEPIGGRYMVQTYWILWILLAFGAASWIATRGKSASYKWTVVLAVSAFLFLFHGRLYFVKGAIRPLENSDLLRSVQLLRTELTDDQVVLSTRAYYLRIAGSLNARQAGEGEEAVSFQDLVAGCKSGLVWGVHLDDASSVQKGQYGRALQAILEGDDRFGGYPNIRISDQTSIIRCSSQARQ